jgi:hypothetical protein
MTAQTTAPAAGARSSWSGRAAVLTALSVVVLAITLTWSFLSMRAVMGVGGSCADGGPYVSQQPCPGGSFLIAIAVPVMVVTAMAGSAAALSIDAPNLLIPMWGFLFAALGWNFLEFAFTGPQVVWSWLVCGAMFWLMAAPAVVGILVALTRAVLPPRSPKAGAGSRWWVPAYAALGSLGAVAGGLSFVALS